MSCMTLKGHQGNSHTFGTIRRPYWWLKLWQDIVKYIGKCSICARHQPNRYLKQYLDVLKVPMAVLAMDTIDHLPITSHGNMWTLMAICLHTSHIFVVPMWGNSAEKCSTGLDVDFSYCWLNLEVKLYSLEQYIGLIEDKLSSTTVDFFRSEGYLETKCLYWIREPKKC